LPFLAIKWKALIVIVACEGIGLKSTGTVHEHIIELCPEREKNQEINIPFHQRQRQC
jgi:hypothetical protein